MRYAEANVIPHAIAVSDFFTREIIPLPQSDIETLDRYQTTHEFYEEVKYRQAFDDYCQWYYAVAEQHRRELETMRREINFMSWFRWTKAR